MGQKAGAASETLSDRVRRNIRGFGRHKYCWVGCLRLCVDAGGSLSDFHEGLSAQGLLFLSRSLTFSEFVVTTFPIGSDAKDAISQITKGGFEVTTSSSDSVELLWRRHAGPCNELYSIVVNQTADGTIAKITGRLHPTCL
jgi:hypothetical protein